MRRWLSARRVCGGPLNLQKVLKTARLVASLGELPLQYSKLPGRMSRGVFVVVRVIIDCCVFGTARKRLLRKARIVAAIGALS